MIAIDLIEGVPLLLGSMQDIGDFLLFDFDVEGVEDELALNKKLR